MLKNGVELANLEKYIAVTNVEVVGSYQLHLTFSDESERVIDFKDVLVGPVFDPLHDHALFDQVTVNPDTGTIEWPTGADFSPVVLHEWPLYEARLKDQIRRQLAVV